MSGHNITTSDIRDAGFCVDGLREWVEAQDLDLRKVVKGKYTIEELAHIHDANFKRVVDAAKKRHGIK